MKTLKKSIAIILSLLCLHGAVSFAAAAAVLFPVKDEEGKGAGA